ncbi:MAG: MFS transporter [Promethearchaeota archaeon]
MTGRFARFFGLENESKRVQYLAQVLAAWMPLAALAFTLSSTFYSIYVAQLLAPTDIVLGFAFVGILAAISMGVQVMVDYPTGGIGDWIGQRWILSASYACFGIVFFLTSLGVFFPYFWFFILVYIIMAIAAALNSGALMAWFDNNYRVAAQDPKRKAYSKAQGRMGMFFQIAATAVLIPGAILASIFLPTTVYFFQTAMCGFLCVGALILFRDSPEVIENRPKRSLTSYFTILKDGLKFSVSSRLVLSFLIGTVLVTSTITVWADMILFLIYWQYLGQNIVAIAVFRTFLFAFGVLWIERAGIWTRNLNPPKWIPRSRLLQTCGPLFYFIFAVIYLFMPPVGIFIAFPFMYFQISTILICIGFIITGLFTAYGNILNQRFMLDLIPDKIRNGIYSLIPTLTLLFAIPQFLLFAPLLVLFGPAAVLYGLGVVSLIGVVILVLGLQEAPEKPILAEEEVLMVEEPTSPPITS